SASARLALRVDGTVNFVPISAITHVTADGYCAMVHTVRRRYHVRETLTSLERRLPARFARVHRSTIVNLDGVESIEPLTHGEARVQLACGASLKVSRNFRRGLDPLLG